MSTARKSENYEKESIKYPLAENLKMRRGIKMRIIDFELKSKQCLCCKLFITVENSEWKLIVIFVPYIGARTTPQISNNFNSTLPFYNCFTLFLINFFLRNRGASFTGRLFFEPFPSATRLNQLYILFICIQLLYIVIFSFIVLYFLQGASRPWKDWQG